MSERMMGLETEHGFAVPGRDLRARNLALERLMALARKMLPHLPGYHGSGLFLGNGSRFYIDSGSHPEFCTPEVDCPFELVRYVSAGDLILARLAAETAALERLPPIMIYKCHVDYRDRSTWGCHENFGHKARQALLPRQLIPHLVTRLIFTGAGGLNPFSHGIEFCLSSRVFHLEADSTDNSTGCRGIYHTKNETLAGHGWSRLHVLCGESVLSHRALFLKAATTALVVALIEAGLRPGDAMQFAAPLEAMRAFNADPLGRATARLADGREVTALQAQFHFLSFVEERLEHPALPRWAAVACRLWRETLEMLARGLAAASRTLDWAIKFALYHEHLARRGVTPTETACWNSVLCRFELPWDNRHDTVKALTPELLLASGSPFQKLVREVEPQLREHGLSWDRLRHFLQVRAELCELEARFSQLGPQGLFNTLDAAGQLRHALPEVTPASIEEATHTPPPRGRAGVRGRLIQELWAKGQHSADWDAVWDAAGRRIDLSDPFQNRAPAWTPAAAVRPPRQEFDPSVTVLADANRAYDLGEYERAWSLLQSLRQWHNLTGRPAPPRHLQLIAWVQSRRGQYYDSVRAADELARSTPRGLDAICAQVCAHRFAGLAPRAEAMREPVRQGDELIARNPTAASPSHFAFLGHKAALLRNDGRLAEARAVLEQAHAMALPINPVSRVLARNLCDLADVHRRLNEPVCAAACLHQARQIQESNGFLGDFAEFNLTARARLIAHVRTEAKMLLNQSRLALRRSGHRPGMARTMFLQARLFPSLWHNQRRKRLLLSLQRDIPALRDCPLATRILNHWDQWVGGHCEPGEDFFWSV